MQQGEQANKARPDRHPPSPVQVAICAATCRRPQGLARLLDGLASLRFDGAEPVIRVIIVDNDPAGGAKSIVDGRRSAFPWPLLYVHEPNPGIVAARNAALDAVDVRDAFIAFIDDDESPSANWLEELLRAQAAHEADVVTGPVECIYEPGVPDWVIAGRFFERPSHTTGDHIALAATNNVLFRASFVHDHPLRFDPRYQPMGEDNAFFRALAAVGGRIIWSQQAMVREWIPADRARAGWLIRRMHLVGRSMSRIAISQGHPVTHRIVQGAKGVVWLMIGLVTLPCGLLARRWAVRSLRWLAYGAGLLRGLR